MVMFPPVVTGGMGARLPEASVWQVAQPEQQHFPEQEAPMAAGKKRICLILAQVVGRVRGPEGLTIKENLMIRCLMTPWRSVQRRTVISGKMI